MKLLIHSRESRRSRAILMDGLCDSGGLNRTADFSPLDQEDA